MGLMFSDFGAGFFGNQAQQAGERRQLTVREALEAKREERRLAEEERRRSQGMEDAVTMRNLDAAPRIGLDPTGKPSLMLDTFAMEGGKPTRKTERLGDAPVTPVRYGTQTTAAGKVSGRYMSDGTFHPDGEPLPPRAAGGGGAPIGEDGMTPYQRAQHKLAVEREARLNEQGARGKDTKRNPRKDFMDESKFIAGADADSLATYLKSVGATVPDRTSAEVLNAPVTDENDHYAGVLRRIAKTEAERRLGDAQKPANQRPKDSTPTFAEAAAEVKRRRPDLSDADVRAYLASKGIRP